MRRSASLTALPKCSTSVRPLTTISPFARQEPDARDGRLAATGPEEEGWLLVIVVSSSGERLRPLGLMRMVGAGVDLELSQLLGAEAVPRQHALHGAPDDLFGPALQQVTERLLLEALRVAAVADVELAGRACRGSRPRGRR